MMSELVEVSYKVSDFLCKELVLAHKLYGFRHVYISIELNTSAAHKLRMDTDEYVPGLKGLVNAVKSEIALQI